MVYAAGDYGNVAPTRTIMGPDTQMGVPTGLAVDSDGDIYVTNWFGGTPCAGTVTVYAAGANGDAAPIAQIKGLKTRLCDPGGIAIDSKRNMYVTSGQQYSSAVNVYAAGSNGNVRPIAEISGRRTLLFDPAGITLDALGNIYVSSEGDGTLVKYRAGAHDDAKPVQAIYGIRTKLQFANGIAVDPSDEIYANNTIRPDVVVLASDANGDVPPIRIIRKNRRSNLRRPTNIAVR
jgi:sugar lactone lactonase YvrE